MIVAAILGRSPCEARVEGLQSDVMPDQGTPVGLLPDDFPAVTPVEQRARMGATRSWRIGSVGTLPVPHEPEGGGP